MKNDQLLTQPLQNKPQPPAKPNESGQFSVQGVVKIFDPNTKTVFVETRA